MKRKLIILIIGLFLSIKSMALTPWNKNTVYYAGDIVTYNNQLFVASYWNQENLPNKDILWNTWVYIDNEKITFYDHEKPYESGSIVNYNNKKYLSKWWVQREYPSESNAWILLENLDSELSPPTENINPKSSEAIHGVDSDNDGIRDSYKSEVFKKYNNPEFIQLALAISFEYADLHKLALNEIEVIELNKEDAVIKYNKIIAFEACANHLLENDKIDKTPLQLYANSIYRALYYRLGKERLFQAMEHDLDAFIIPEVPCYNILNM